MSIHHHDFFNDKSDVYRLARPLYPSSLIEFVSSISPSNSCAWDCATGNGQAAVGLSEFFEKVVATDVSENQISQAIKGEGITYFVQEAEYPDFPLESVDLITVAQALHWFDYSKFWPAVDKVLKPDGVFAAWGYDWFSVSQPVDELITSLVLDKIEGYWAPQNRILWQGYKDLQFPFSVIDTPDFDLSMKWDLNHLFNYIHSWSATRRCIEKEGDDFLRSAFDEVATIWGKANESKIVSMPLHILVGRK